MIETLQLMTISGCIFLYQPNRLLDIFCPEITTGIRPTLFFQKHSSSTTRSLWQCHALQETYALKVIIFNLIFETIGRKQVVILNHNRSWFPMAHPAEGSNGLEYRKATYCAGSGGCGNLHCTYVKLQSQLCKISNIAMLVKRAYSNHGFCRMSTHTCSVVFFKQESYTDIWWTNYILL